MEALSRLDQAVSAVAPIDGVSIGDINDRATWVVFFKPEATPGQVVAAQNVINTFDPTSLSVEETRRKNLSTDLTVIELKNTLLNATPAQINSYVNAQVTDIATAKTMIKKILLVLALALNNKPNGA